MGLQGHPRSLILAPIDSAYTIPMVINGNIRPLRDNPGFLLRRATPTLFHPNFRSIHLGLDCRCCGYEEQRPSARVINFELVQPICPRYINVTDLQTDGRTTYDSNTALVLRASRGKNTKIDQLSFSKITPTIIQSYSFLSFSTLNVVEYGRYEHCVHVC